MNWTLFWTLMAQVSIATVLLFIIATFARIWYFLFFGTNTRQDSYDIFNGTGRND